MALTRQKKTPSIRLNFKGNQIIMKYVANLFFMISGRFRLILHLRRKERLELVTGFDPCLRYLWSLDCGVIKSKV